MWASVIYFSRARLAEVLIPPCPLGVVRLFGLSERDSAGLRADLVPWSCSVYCLWQTSLRLLTAEILLHLHTQLWALIIECRWCEAGLAIAASCRELGLLCVSPEQRVQLGLGVSECPAWWGTGLRGADVSCSCLLCAWAGGAEPNPRAWAPPQPHCSGDPKAQGCNDKLLCP